jgi:hypothetical protein
MGYMRHHAIVVTGWDGKAVKLAHDMAIEKEMDPTPIVLGKVNEQHSFMIPPDGSKEGWQHSDEGNDRRTIFLDWLDDIPYGLDYVEIEFGGDGGPASITRDRDM